MKHNFLGIAFGNEDKMESGEFWFSTPKECAEFLRNLASQIETFPTSKAYRASDESIFEAYTEEQLNKLAKMNEN